MYRKINLRNLKIITYKQKAVENRNCFVSDTRKMEYKQYIEFNLQGWCSWSI